MLINIYNIVKRLRTLDLAIHELMMMMMMMIKFLCHRTIDHSSKKKKENKKHQLIKMLNNADIYKMYPRGNVHFQFRTAK